MARFAGWGALPQVFARPEWEKERAELKELLSPSEYEEAMQNALNAHYTDARLAKPMWDALEALGFNGGHVLEAGSGTGTFIGLAPKDAKMTGVEMESSTAAISKLLYPDANIRHESFGKTKVNQGEWDAFIGNVPFGNFPVADAEHNPKNQWNIHDHFIKKEVAGLKPGGIGIVITSAGTLDKDNSSARRAIGEDADLLGAVRLPSKAHEGTAGTPVVTDVLVFRKRMPGEEPGDQSWLTSSPAYHPDGSPVLGTNREGGREHYAINDYFAQNPDMVLGDLADGGYNGMAVKGDPDATADDPRAYIDLERVEEEKRNECVGRYDAYLRRLGVLDDTTAEEIKNEALETMRQGIAAAEAEPEPDPELVFDNAYVLPPPNMREGWDG